MQEKTDWELVDEPMRQSHWSKSEWSSHDQAQSRAQGAAGMKPLLQAMMGRWWRWKLIGAGLFAALTLIMVAMLTGVVALIAAASAVLAIGITKVRQWTRRHSSALTP
ncbi:hypothetical protein EDC30_105170 [Paucimonas lemoignei]|uniref:Uncharacterized protein n=1 Tax=Paucimonas lemoignei TaxID=29443 RepID=A0A4R3HV39_PAULE|nr:hypothetical protein [Paucimonas lemoignei]TCS36948.1 hypothetical protein EDC30_105170 [Paucimonas lemoignei]